jgi:hypothetical protein
MFPSTKIRFATAIRRSFDLAIEFATLGEYGLEPAPERPARGARRSAGPFRAMAGSDLLAGSDLMAAPGVSAAPGAVATAATAPPGPLATRLRPATAAARRLQPATPARRVHPIAPAQRISARTAVRELALDAPEVRTLRGARTRGGSARPRPQPCLVAEQSAGS